MKEIDISTRECSHIVADIALPEDIYNTFKKDMLEKYYNNEISFDLIEFKNSKYVNDRLPSREKIIVNMQVDEDDYEALLTICNKNQIDINKLYDATFFEFSVLEEYNYTTPVAS
jgi:hypothetical protein